MDATPAQLDELHRLGLTTQRAHRTLRRKHLGQLDALFAAAPDLYNDTARAEVVDALKRLKHGTSWEVALLEDQAVAEGMAILGVERGLAFRNPFGTAFEGDIIRMIREEFSLAATGPDEWETYFLKHPRKYAAAHGITVDEAKGHAARKAVQWSRAHLDRELSLARRGTANASLRRRGFRKYRRVLRGESCPFCILISDRTYFTEHLLPGHQGCNCGVLPVAWDAEASDFSDAAALANARDVKVYRRRKGAAKQLARTKVVEYHDPSYGPSVKGSAPRLPAA